MSRGDLILLQCTLVEAEEEEEVGGEDEGEEEVDQDDNTGPTIPPALTEHYILIILQCNVMIIYCIYFVCFTTALY